jgi:hypothetical protein
MTLALSLFPFWKGSVLVLVLASSLALFHGKLLVDIYLEFRIYMIQIKLKKHQS